MKRLKKVFIAGDIKILEYADKDYFSSHATRALARSMKINKGDIICEPGCGSGVLSILCSKMGAGWVYGTDIDEISIKFAEKNLKENNIKNVTILKGDLLSPVSHNVKIDVILANLPNKPSHINFSIRYYGGWDGTDNIMRLIQEAKERLKSGARLYLYLNSISNPFKVLKYFEEHFDVKKVSEKKRYFSVKEFENYANGLFSHLIRLRDEGKSLFYNDRFGYYFMGSIYMGLRK